MKKKLNSLLVACIAFMLPVSSQTALLSVLDTGVDLGHQDIVGQIWVNSGETVGNGEDDDANGYRDDINGWNFVDGTNETLNRGLIAPIDADVREFFYILSKVHSGTATSEETNWIKNRSRDRTFMLKVGRYAGFAHGTHVAGIALRGNPHTELMAVKILKTQDRLSRELANIDEMKGIKTLVFKGIFWLVARASANSFAAIGEYLAGHNVDVANLSFGVSYTFLSRMMKRFVPKSIDDREEFIDETLRHFFKVLIKRGESFFTNSPGTLFVAAAGNDGTNNDIYPAYPTNGTAANLISVGAHFGGTVASFSNFGVNTVDVLAPGVAIESAVPGNQYLRVSGTSQAAPYVSGVASAMKDINPALTPVQLKEIIMGTVDRYANFANKVISGGIVNRNRAIRAAEHSLHMDIPAAIGAAQSEVPVGDGMSSHSYIY